MTFNSMRESYKKKKGHHAEEIIRICVFLYLFLLVQWDGEVVKLIIEMYHDA